MGRIKSGLEQTAVYGGLLILLAMMILFGIAAAEKGIQSLVGTDDPEALVVKSAPSGEVKVKILGKDMSGTEKPWAEQLSRKLDEQDSRVAQTADSLSIQIGTWMEAGSRKVLESLSGIFQ
jgi:hypothetical protein